MMQHLSKNIFGVLLVLLSACQNPKTKDDKIWLHRVNSLEKLTQLKDSYSNFEVDVVVREGGVLDVTHDIDTTFHLMIDPYFSYLRERRSMWLDIKNLSPQNAPLVLSRIDSLCRINQVWPSQLIIESKSVEALRIFTQKGWYTSYYVLFPDPGTLHREQQDTFLDSLRRVVDSGAVRALSFPGNWYYTIRRDLHRDIDLLTWKHHTTWKQLLSHSLGIFMWRDPQLKVILVKEKGDYHR